MSQLFLLKHGLQRMRFHTSHMLREGGTLGKPMGAKKGKGLAKTNWDRPTASTTATMNKRVAPKRDWKKPVDQHAEKHAGESYKTHERHVNKFAPAPAKRTETIAQKRERKKKEEELHLLAKEEEKERHLMAVRKAKLKAKDLAESNHMKDVFIPEIINVANLSRVLGVRIGK